MKWIIVVLLMSVVEDAYTADKRQRLQDQKHRKFYREYTSATSMLTQSNSDIYTPQQQNRMPEKLNLLDATKAQPILEIDTLQCPSGCVCQYAHFKDLSISRWINYMQTRHPDTTLAQAKEMEDELDNKDVYENDDSVLLNPYMKQATCILQADMDSQQLISTLPQDLQALILLYTDIGRNKSVNLSILKSLNQLITLEIRGEQDRSLRLIFDEPLSFLQHANFESITLLGSENFERPVNPVHPSDSFDYKPRGELFEDIDADEDDKLAFAMQETNEILPYDVYMQEVKKARIPTFYGWEHLEVLRIYDCKLQELQWEMFDGLEALQHLSLERNAIEEVPAFSLYGALHIRTLSLASNRIHSLHYRALAGLLELEVLNLRDNRLGKLSERSFPPFPKLESIDFRGNPIKHILPASFWVMNTTRAMSFDSQELPLELWGNQPFESLVELQDLSIGNVSITSLEHSIFKGLVSLEKLVLKGRVRRIEFDAFAGLNELRELDLSSCGICEISMDALMGCKNLEVLDLAHNYISYIPPGLFDDQTKLQEIYLQNNQLYSLPINFFLQPKLRLARLSDNPWQCSCDMRNWRPKITNQERGPRKKRCITDFQTGRKIACHYIDNFNYDSRYAPRCSNYNGRSVFYVLRKQLQCSEGSIVHTRRHMLTTELSKGDKKHAPRRYYQNEHPMRQGKPVRALRQNKPWAVKQRRIGARIFHNDIKHNTLDYTLQQAPRQTPKGWQQSRTETVQELPNEI